jgi:tetratricopeptide (TPR) repeat protein
VSQRRERSPSDGRRRVSALALVLLVAAPGWAQRSDAPSVAPTPAISERLQVTSVDLWVGVDRGQPGSGPKLEPAELELRLAGEAAPIAAVEKRGVGSERRRVVVFIDTVLGDQTSIRWSASRLAERAADLIAVGDVEVVVADPEPRVALAATREVERLDEVLSGLALFAGTDAAIPLLRDEFASLSEDDADLDLARSFMQDESALVVQRQDLLLRWLIDEPSVSVANGPRPASGGVLLYVSQGFDPDPSGFYLGVPDRDGWLSRETARWVRTIAAYGWTCAPLVYEDRRAMLRRGLRIGKWRFGGPRNQGGGSFVLLSASREGERDAGKAAALVELGDTQLAAGSNELASDAYLRAIHHFYGDPRTKSRQAYAWRQLALALQRSGQVDPARRAFANALELDPALADQSPEMAGAMDGVEGLDRLASETGGHLLRGSRDLLAAIDELSRRQRLSFTLPGTPSGDLLPVELTAKSRASPLRYARWTRSGAPERIAGARLRLFLEAAATEPIAEGSTSLSLAPASAGRSLVAVSLPEFDCSQPCRVLLGTLGEDSPASVVALTPESSRSRPGSWRGEIEESGDVIAALYTEDLGSGEWEIALVDASPFSRPTGKQPASTSADP